MAMDRRSLLTLLGLAPVAATLPAMAKGEKTLQAGTLTTDLLRDGPKSSIDAVAEISVITRSWECQEFAAARAHAAIEGRELRPTRTILMGRHEAPDWLQAMVPEWQRYVQTATYEGRIVQAIWWMR